MNSIITPGELAVGMFITVLSNKPFKQESMPGIIMGDVIGGVETKTIVHEDNSGKGDVLKVLAVQLPYIVVDCYSKFEKPDYRFKFDVRRTEFMELTKEYVLAMNSYLAEEFKDEKIEK